MVIRFLAPAAIVLGVAGCGSHDSIPTGSGQLHVQQLVAKGSPFPIEGAYHYVRVTGDSGSLKRRLSFERTPQTTLQLPAGDYRLESWQRTCDGNCGYLDQPSDRCETGFELQARQRLEATVTVDYGSGCTISFG